MKLRYGPEVVSELVGLEEEFRSDTAKRAVRLFRITVACLVAVYLVYIPTTAVFPFGSAPFANRGTVLVLEGVGLGFAVVALALSYWRSFPRYHQPITVVSLLAIGAQSTAVCLLFPRPADYLALQTIVLLCVAAYTVVGLRMVAACIAGVGLILGFVGLASVLGELHVEHVLQTVTYLATANLVGGVTAYRMEQARRHDFLVTRQLQAEREQSEALLLNVLPAAIADRLKAGEAPIADRVEKATVLFADLAGFTGMSAEIPAEELVRRLEMIFGRFDALVAEAGLEKIKTIGDAYMVVGGVPTPRADHGPAVARLALAMRRALRDLGEWRGWELELRIGIHSGPVVAGVIGQKKFAYDVWGDTVNVASRMESHGLAGAIQISGACRAELGDAFAVEPRGEIDVRGRGPMSVYLLDEERTVLASERAKKVVP